MKNIRIGRQPILDENSKICAYALMYREDLTHNYSSASLMSNVLNKFGTGALLGDKRAFVTIDEKFLLHDLILSIPDEFFILSLASSIELTPRVVERIELLHSKGYLLSIEHLGLCRREEEEYLTILKYLSFVKIDIRNNEDCSLQKIIKKFKTSNIKVVGDNIYDSKQYKRAREYGCDWFEGYFFAELKIVENPKYDASYMQVLNLYKLLMDDVNIDEITKEFEKSHEITLQLLQFINSGAFHFRKRISTIHHILVLVGRIPLAQWLMLMIYSKSLSKHNQKTPLMLMVKNRTEMMQNILKILKPEARSNMLGEAYFVGVLSLIDRLFCTKLENILQGMQTSEDVGNALLKREGLLGEILTLIEKVETFDAQAAIAFEKKYNLNDGILNEIIIQSMQSVQSFEDAKPPQE